MKIRIEDKAGFYFTVIMHLTVIVVLLVTQINYTAKHDAKFLLDFSRTEEKEKQKEEKKFKDDISKKLDRLLNTSPDRYDDYSDIRNIAVDASSMKDDRGTDVDELYKDAERLAESLKSGAKTLSAEDQENFVDLTPEKKPRKEKIYTGPSVISYSLDGRKARNLKIPAYRCLGGGDVTVRITVDQSGKVVGAKVVDEFSSEDTCLRNFAIRAARASSFTASQEAPKRQYGDIVYRFIAQ